MKPQEIIRTNVVGERIVLSDINVRFVENGTDGLIAWASCVISGTIKLDNIAIRLGRDGNLFLTYPAKLTVGGKKYHYFNPISIEAADAIQDALLDQVIALAEATAIGRGADVGFN